ncbi:hypothetical protein [Ruminococcus sp. NK3A76]|uniref:hypothetical protein n=1 Tax=Ruminococcus sp. NK3A76 TaxID=877411 RepID=UPI0012EBC5AA|nr:hypothetical protein [Ruminococcus sp. NK3A76]
MGAGALGAGALGAFGCGVFLGLPRFLGCGCGSGCCISDSSGSVACPGSACFSSA